MIYLVQVDTLTKKEVVMDDINEQIKRLENRIKELEKLIEQEKEKNKLSPINQHDIIDALIENGYECHLSNIYKTIKKNKTPEILTKNFEETIRSLIYNHSSDSIHYKPNKPNYFYSLHGVGNRMGFWGLRKEYR